MKQSMGWWGVAMGRYCSRGTMCQLCRVSSADLMYNNVTIINNKKNNYGSDRDGNSIKGGEILDIL